MNISANAIIRKPLSRSDLKNAKAGKRFVKSARESINLGVQIKDFAQVCVTRNSLIKRNT